MSPALFGGRCRNLHAKQTKREKERPERAASLQPRATPWVSVYKRLRPVRAKVWANGWLLLLPLQGVGNGNMAPRALPWATDLLGFQPAQGRRQGFSAQSPPTFNIPILPPIFQGPHLPPASPSPPIQSPCLLAHLGRAAPASAPSDDCIWAERRPSLLPDAFVAGTAFAAKS